MRSPTWAEVALACVAMVQTLGLAFIGRRGVILPPTNRRRPRGRRERVEDELRADHDSSEPPRDE